MADQLVLRTFRAAVADTVQVFRPGDVLDDADPNFAKILTAAPVSGVSPFPLAPPALATAAGVAIEDRLKAVPDDIVEVNLLAAAV